MPKPTDDYDKTHLRNMAAIGTRIDRIFKKAAEEAAKIGVSIKDLPENRIFTFDDYPATQKQIERLMTALQQSMETAIVNGVRSSWTLSNNKNNALVSRIFGERVGDLSKEQYKRYFSTNGAALEAFLQRKEQGLNLSDRVWRYANAFKREIELGLDLGIRSGESAANMTRSLRQYLQHPDKLFRRVRDKHGNLKLSKAAAAFHPGRGVYRSSYKNARRLAATETNIAYHTSDHLRWQQMDFVVGIEIKLSNNHTLNGVPLTDICDTLAGRYPKDFKFTGWHPLCRCRAVTILKTDEEIAEDTSRILDGQKPTKKSVNTVRDVPAAFKDWIEERRDRIEMGGNLPYFIKDNKTIVDGIIKIEKHRKEYERLKTNPDYVDVEFNPKSGGLKATHVRHNFDRHKGQYEKAVQDTGFNTGHSVILDEERDDQYQKRHAEGTWDGLQFEISGRETGTSNNIKRGLEHCADKRDTEIAVLYFPNGDFDPGNFGNALRRYNGLEKLDDGQYVKFKKIICIQDGKIVHEEEP